MTALDLRCVATDITSIVAPKLEGNEERISICKRSLYTLATDHIESLGLKVFGVYAKTGFAETNAEWDMNFLGRLQENFHDALKNNLFNIDKRKSFNSFMVGGLAVRDGVRTFLVTLKGHEVIFLATSTQPVVLAAELDTRERWERMRLYCGIPCHVPIYALRQ